MDLNMMRFMRRFKDVGIQGKMAQWYDNNTKKYRIGEMKQYAHVAARYIKEGDAVLEIAPGPGFLSIELAKMGTYKITGMDISQDFVDIARKNAQQEGIKVDFRQGNVAEIPFAQDVFDLIICTAAFKNFKEPVQSLKEMYRVLKHGGLVLIVDMKKNASNQEINEQVKETGVSGFDAFFMKLTFKYFLRKAAYSKDEFIDIISKTAFERYKIEEGSIGFYIYLRK